MATSSILGTSGSSAQKYNPFAPQKSSSGSFAEALKSATGAGGSCATATKAASDTISDMHKKTDASLADFAQKLDGLLKIEGVDTSQQIRLENDGQNGVKVVGAQADREKIEKVLAAHPDLVAQFQSLATELRRLHDSEQAVQGATPSANAGFGLVLQKGVAKADFT